tara:strand:- start:401 stop:856 length:456 start_codon:yes stop_codon:yes gene_type:complete
MPKKNNNYPILEEVKPAELKLDPTISIDAPVKKLLDKTAERNQVSKRSLIGMAVEAMVGSLDRYGYQCAASNKENRKAASGDGECKITIDENSIRQLNDIGVYFGVKTKDLLQDAVMAQRWNWQRMQPVNARSMSSIRLHMFHLEQLGPNR